MATLSSDIAGEARYPTGAHYLPLPSRESTHVREMLAEFGIILDGAQTERPYYDERHVVHAPESRVLIDGVWHDGLLPANALASGCAQRTATLLRPYRRTIASARQRRQARIRHADRRIVCRHPMARARHTDLCCLAGPRGLSQHGAALVSRLRLPRRLRQRLRFGFGLCRPALLRQPRRRSAQRRTRRRAHLARRSGCAGSEACAGRRSDWSRLLQRPAGQPPPARRHRRSRCGNPAAASRRCASTRAASGSKAMS